MFFTACGFLHPICCRAVRPESRGEDCVFSVEGAAPSTLNTQSALRLSGPLPGNKLGAENHKLLKTRCIAPENGQKNCPKHVELIEFH
jgi:hypothetical protein